MALGLYSGTLIQKYTYEEDIWQTYVKKKGFKKKSHVQTFHTVIEYVKKTQKFVKIIILLFSVFLNRTPPLKTTETKKTTTFAKFWVFFHTCSVTVMNFRTWQQFKKGPFSWHILARYLPHASIFVLVYLMKARVRPKHVVYCKTLEVIYKSCYI